MKREGIERMAEQLRVAMEREPDKGFRLAYGAAIAKLLELEVMIHGRDHPPSRPLQAPAKLDRPLGNIVTAKPPKRRR
jgi:hypothetical protein